MITKADIERLQKALEDKQYVESVSKIIAYKLANAMIEETKEEEEKMVNMAFFLLAAISSWDRCWLIGRVGHCDSAMHLLFGSSGCGGSPHQNKIKGKIMKEIVMILMRRDGLSKEEAIAAVKSTMTSVRECIEEGDFEAAEEIFTSELGLEPDYLINVIM